MEFGEADRVSLPHRFGRFLNVIYNLVAAEAKLHVEGKREEYFLDYLMSRLEDSPALGATSDNAKDCNAF